MKQSKNLVRLTSRNWKREVLEAELPVLVDFTAAWCQPCQLIAPLIERLADATVGKLKVGKIDIDKASKVADKENIRSVPTLIVYKKGKIVGCSTGYIPLRTLVLFVKKAAGIKFSVG